jgi:hypothetical protein
MFARRTTAVFGEVRLAGRTLPGDVEGEERAERVSLVSLYVQRRRRLAKVVARRLEEDYAVPVFLVKGLPGVRERGASKSPSWPRREIAPRSCVESAAYAARPQKRSAR